GAAHRPEEGAHPRAGGAPGGADRAQLRVPRPAHQLQLLRGAGRVRGGDRLHPRRHRAVPAGVVLAGRAGQGGRLRRALGRAAGAGRDRDVRHDRHPGAHQRAPRRPGGPALPDQPGLRHRAGGAGLRAGDHRPLGQRPVVRAADAHHRRALHRRAGAHRDEARLRPAARGGRRPAGHRGGRRRQPGPAGHPLPERLRGAARPGAGPRAAGRGGRARPPGGPVHLLLRPGVHPDGAGLPRLGRRGRHRGDGAQRLGGLLLHADLDEPAADGHLLVHRPARGPAAQPGLPERVAVQRDGLVRRGLRRTAARRPPGRRPGPPADALPGRPAAHRGRGRGDDPDVRRPARRHLQGGPQLPRDRIRIRLPRHRTEAVMLVFISRRLLSAAVTVLLAAVLVFAAVQLLPGDVATQVLGQDATPDAVAALRDRLGLDRPAVLRFLDWLAGAVRGDFGASLVSGEPVADALALHLRNTLLIAVATIAVAVTSSIVLGVLAGLYRDRWPDTVISSLTLIGMSVPEFVVATLLV